MNELLQILELGGDLEVDVGVLSRLDSEGCKYALCVYMCVRVVCVCVCVCACVCRWHGRLEGGCSQPTSMV